MHGAVPDGRSASWAFEGSGAAREPVRGDADDVGAAAPVHHAASLGARLVDRTRARRVDARTGARRAGGLADASDRAAGVRRVLVPPAVLVGRARAGPGSGTGGG